MPQTSETVDSARRIFAIGDIHGCSQTFRKLLMEELHLRPHDEVCCIGDYIDRGPDSKGVVDFILELRSKGFRIHTLRGNHEQMMMDSVLSREDYDRWLMNGGRETMESFHILSWEELDPVYQAFFRETRFYWESGDFIFVHAGLNFEPDDPFEDKEAMLWSREFLVNRQKLGNRSIVHGHTPQMLESILKQSGRIINIDGGCVYKNRLGMGHLVAFEASERKFISSRNRDE